MAKGKDSSEPFDEDTYHKQLVWEEFLQRAVEAGNKAIDWFDLADYAEEMVAESVIEEVYNERWNSTGDVVMAAFNFLWPEIESLAIKLGVPFEPEIMEIHGIEDGN
jgi:hypothetical protein